MITEAAKRIGDLDYLRFMAALMVVFFHYSFRGYAADSMTQMPYLSLAPIAKYGFLGVKLFFTISGFVILMTVSKTWGLKSFIISRVARLYPAYWFGCTLTFLTIIFFGQNHFSADIWQYLGNMTMFQEFLKIPSIDGAYWTLTVELKFYILVSAILVFGLIDHVEKFIFFWFSVTLLNAFIPTKLVRWIFITDHSVFFIAGAMFFLIFQKGWLARRALFLLSCWAYAVYLMIDEREKMMRHYGGDFNFWLMALFVTIIFSAMLYVIQKDQKKDQGRFLLLGNLTYPLYVIHQNIGFIIFNNLYPRFNVHVVFWTVVILMLGMAFLINRYVEKNGGKYIKSYLQNI